MRISKIKERIDKPNIRALIGRNILNGEKRIIVRRMSIKALRPSLVLTKLLPVRLLTVMGTYLTLSPSRKKAKVIVVEIEKPLGKM